MLLKAASMKLLAKLATIEVVFTKLFLCGKVGCCAT